MHVRTLRPEDVPAAAAVAAAVLPGPPGVEAERAAWLEHRITHLSATDPGGAVVAEQDGAVIGLGVALVRDGIWGLSLLGVLPDRQARGTGTALLRATLEHGEDVRGAIILSSEDPRAMRAYARAGFDLRPTVSLAGIVDRAALPAGLQSRASDDVEAAARLGRPVRGGAYGPDDLALLLTRRQTGLLTIPGRGFAIHLDGQPILLAADSGGVGADLLWSCFAAGTRGATVNVDYLTAGQDWAVRACLDAGLVITPGGPVYTRGEVGPLRAWIPSGSIL